MERKLHYSLDIS